MRELAIFGYVTQGASRAATARVAEFLVHLGDMTGLEMCAFEADSYFDLADALSSGSVDVAWLPPIPLVRLEHDGVVTPLVAHRRRGDFHSAMIVRESSGIKRIEDLREARAAWVDPSSASGYAMARIGLAAAGIDVGTVFTDERFVGSHDGVARAVLLGRADVGATYAGTSADETARAPWIELEDTVHDRVRVIARFGDIPNDATVARRTLDAGIAKRVTTALMAMSKMDEHRVLLRRIFGVERFARWQSRGHARLRRSVDDAIKKGLLRPSLTR